MARPRTGKNVDHDYATEHGTDTLQRIRADFADRCPHCWAPAGTPHHQLCPDTPPQTGQTNQEEALF